jgi:Lipopolysaccharide-assembly
MLPGDVKSVFVPTFVNRSGEPRIEFDTTQAVISQFQRDGSLQVTTEANADAILTVVLTGYRLEPVSFRKDIRTATQQYRVIITANMVMRRTKDQTVVAEAPRVEGKFVFDVVGDLSSSKLRANPRVAEDLAVNIVQQLVEHWE